MMDNVKVSNHSFTGLSWVSGWLFTLGFLHLAFWKGVLAIIVWPYYIGVAVSAMIHR